ncbi:cellulose-binding protein, partial [Streptomyces sp. NRRL F-6602]
MSDTSPYGFELVRRGYDRAQVDERISKLVSDRDSALTRITALEKRIEELHLETQNA